MAIRAAVQTSLTFPAADTRRALLAGMVHTSGPALAFREGVIPGGSASLAVTASSGMTLAVQAGQAVVAGYLVTVDAATTVTVAPAGVTARTDLVVLRVRDTEAGDGSSSAVVEMVTGTSASVPATPARSFVLAQVAVGASVSSITSGNLTDRRTWTSSTGGLLLIPGAAASFPALPLGQPVWDSATDRLLIADTSGFREPVPAAHTHSVYPTVTPTKSEIALASGVSAGGVIPRAYRISSSRVALEGVFGGLSLGTSELTMGTVPAGLRPAQLHRQTAWAAGGRLAYLVIGTDGVITTAVVAGPSGTANGLSLDGVTYEAAP